MSLGYLSRCALYVLERAEYARIFVSVRYASLLDVTILPK